jgi:hypothetical protein
MRHPKLQVNRICSDPTQYSDHVAFQLANHYFLHTSMRKGILVLLAIVWMSCDGGLSPTPPPKPGISGVITFAKGTWPGTPSLPDSLSNLWIFASQVYPLDSSLVVSGLFLSSPPTIYLYPSAIDNLPFYVDSVQYFFSLPVGTYKYIGVIQHIAPDFSSIRNLRVVGMAKDLADTAQPRQAKVIDGSITPGINIKVDFHNPPPQPF